jgi:short subunit dehydrogenase-like uncharacterized protein
MSSFKFFLVGESAGGRKLVTTVRGGDPGYTETAKMASEAALALLRQRLELPASKRGFRGGVFTPAFCLGGVLVARLQAAGIRFEAEDAARSPEEILDAAFIPAPATASKL